MTACSPVQDVLLSFKLVGDTSDVAEKAKMVEAMLTYLVGGRHQAENNRKEPTV